MIMNHIKGALGALLIVLPQISYAIVRYTEADACRAALTEASVTHSNSDRVLSTLQMIRESAMNTVKSEPADAPAHQASRELLSVVERIAAAPTYADDDGFAMTEVLEGNADLNNYADRLGRMASRLTERRVADVSARDFDLRRLIGRSVAPALAIGLGAATFSYITRQPELSTVALLGWTAVVGGLGYLAADEFQAIATRWRAYFRPERRAEWSMAHAKLPDSTFFQSFRTLTGLQMLITQLGERDVKHVGAFSVQKFDVVEAELSAAELPDSIPTPTGRRLLDTNDDGAEWLVGVESVFYIEPKSNRPYAVVHVRGDRL